MAQTVNQLTATKVHKLKTPGMYPDGAGLYLQVTGENAKSWLFRYSLWTFSPVPAKAIYSQVRHTRTNI